MCVPARAIVGVANIYLILLFSEVLNLSVEENPQRFRLHRPCEFVGPGIPAGYYVPIRDEVMLRPVLPDKSSSVRQRLSVGARLNRHSCHGVQVNVGHQLSRP
jgi:hypothetical protein